MKTLVINGAPSGNDSITLQTFYFIQANGLADEYRILHAGQRIRQYEKDFTEADDALKEADLILFSYPVYTFLVPAQLHRFIELIKEHGVDVSGKYAAQITTSKHFYDMTAHRFIEDICADLGLKYLGGLSADMEDLLHEQGQKEALDFFRYVLYRMAKDDVIPHRMPEARTERYQATDNLYNGMKREGTAALIYDDDPDHPDEYLMSMIRRFTERTSLECRLINLRTFPFAGGCLGCFNCASDGKCIYKDGFDSFLRENINGADAVVYAFTVRDHSMGSRFKMYDDRQFCNGHRTVTMGKPVAYLINGDLSAQENLRTVIEARAETGGNTLAGIVTNTEQPDRAIDLLAERLEYILKNDYTQPKNFYGVGGLKIFRDLIWQMQGLMKEDHRFYKAHGFYDFPQKQRMRIAGMYLVSAMMNSRTLQKKMPVSMTEGMLMPYRMVIDKAKK